MTYTDKYYEDKRGDLLFSTICPHCDELFNDSVDFMTHEGQCEFESNLKRAYQISNLIDDYYEPINGRASEYKENERRLELIRKVIENHREVLRAMDDNIRIGFKRLSDDAILPTKAHPTDSGYDLYAAEDVIIEPGDTAVVKTGIAVELPSGYEAQIRPRSGVTAKTKLRVQLGTIDNGYRGELGIIVDNIAIPEMQLSTEYTDYTYVVKNKEWALLTIDGDYGRGENIYPETTYLIRKGDRIAQLVIQCLPETVAIEIDEFSEDSERGEGGFGSSGV